MMLLILLQFMQYLVSNHIQILSVLGMLVVGGGGLLHQLIRYQPFFQGIVFPSFCLLFLEQLIE